MIANDLIEAYIGYHELDEAVAYERDGTPIYLLTYQRDVVAAFLYLYDDNQTRLEVYCHWNGIIGYSKRLYEIATTGPVDRTMAYRSR